MNDREISPSAKPENPPSSQVWGFWATVGFGLIIVIVSVAIDGVTALIFLTINILSGRYTGFSQLEEALANSEGLLLAIVAIAETVICTGLIAAFIRIRQGSGFSQYLGFRQIVGKTALLLLAITLGFVVVSEGLPLIFDIPVETEFVANIYKTSIWPPLLWLAVIVFVPFFEETLFRGFLFEGFRHSRIGLAGAVVMLALIWALLHTQYGLYEIASIFVLGIILGIVRYKTGSLWSVILMHALVNLIATVEVAIKTSAL